MDTLNLVVAKISNLQIEKDKMMENEKKTSADIDLENEKLSIEILAKFREATSMADIEDIGFTFNEDSCILNCNVCDGKFKYESSELDFTSKNMSRMFRNLKHNVKNHLLTTKHQKEVIRSNREKENSLKAMSKNQVAGFNVGRIAYAT